MLIRRNRGIKLGRKLIRVFKWITRRRRPKYLKLGPKPKSSGKKSAISRLLYKWGKSIKQGFLNPGRNRGYIRVGNDPEFDPKPGQVPKGHLAVYVGERDGEIQRVLVPVLFLNHPLFEKLLKDAEDEFGFNHPGRITIPCPLSEFEYVQTKIAAGEKFRHRSHRPGYVSGIKCL